MSVIRSVAHQWDKAEFSYQLHNYLICNQDVVQLFSGATNCQTVCHLIAAMAELPSKSNEGNFDITTSVLIDVLLQCFLLLYVKKVEYQSLSQGEQLILSLTEKLAGQAIKTAEQDANVVKKSKIILSAMENLERTRAKLRSQHSNMGK